MQNERNGSKIIDNSLYTYVDCGSYLELFKAMDMRGIAVLGSFWLSGGGAELRKTEGKIKT
mgnify:CR=1 FL=1